MTNEVENLPELRFSGFSGKWEEKNFEELFDIHNNLRKPIKESHRVEGIYRYYGATGVIDFVNHYIFDGEYILIGEDGANIITRSAPLVYLAKGKFWVNNHAHILTPKNGNIYYLFLVAENVNYLKYNTGTAQPKLNIQNLKNINVNITIDINEQQKIGNFFSKLDRQIELEEQKLAKLEKQKKGYMQQIFSQELRFKDEDGNIYPDWKEYVLGETGNTYSGLSSKTKEDFGYGNSYFITYMNVFKNTIAKANMIEKVNIQENEKQNKVKYKDILFTTSSEVPEETGMSSIWLYKESNVYLNSFCFGFRVTCDDIEPIYLTRFLRSEKMRKQITILSQGSTRFNISKKEVMKLKIDVPNLEEQTKIVNFLSKYDSLIESQSNKIDLLKERKKGFLQKMFV
ncbi:restriction endonuclease subunit S [Staphylococcus equorum]|uniref:restriction endonuclease subunit S n=1 Tax=Staphylococcus equorum TaxID=246432 RepID=UPI002DBD08A6|nr:restriction endonuclease subunit S [Staphylococcus equorum]MEB8174854.1 restriction endonuclease subunit S [Staphylococcus equorum]